MSWISRIRNALRPGRTAGELDDELEFHIEQRTDDLVRDGMPREEAMLQARRQFGNRLQLREASQDAKSAGWLEAFPRDFRFGLRMFAKYRTANLAAVVSLGLALGACAAAFALIDALVFRPLPLPAQHQLIDLARVMPAFMSPENQAREADGFSYPAYQLLRDAARDSADLFAMRLTPGLRPAQFDDAAGTTENIRAESMSGRGFEILGVKAALGRLIQPDDNSQTDGYPVAVLSHAFWMRRFGGSASVIGHWMRFDRKQYQIIGVAADPFSGVQPGYLTDVWVPLDPDQGSVNIWGRLHSGVQAPQVRARLQGVLTNFMRERVRIDPPRNLHGEQLRQFTDAPLRARDASTGRGSLFRLQFRVRCGFWRSSAGCCY